MATRRLVHYLPSSRTSPLRSLPSHHSRRGLDVLTRTLATTLSNSVTKGIEPTKADGRPRFSPQPRLDDVRGNPSIVRCFEHNLQYFNLHDKAYKNISGTWLRDNCNCPACRNQETAQRQINTLKGKIDCTVVEARPTSDHLAYEITFGDGHKTTLTKAFFRSRPSPVKTQLTRTGQIPIHQWGSEISARPPIVQFHDVDRAGLGDLLHKIRTHGFCFVEGLEPTPEATETILQSIGPITNTHYGGFYDFTSDLSSKDTAYTSEALEPHNDNSYFTVAAGLQALHLLSHTDGSGGESSLVDGFAAATKLLEQDPQAYSLLSAIRVYAHASGNDGISIQPAEARPVLLHSSLTKSLLQVTWNNADRAGLACSYGLLETWYEAAAKFDALLSDPANQYWFQLKPGTLLIFDNWRVLHGRAAFSGKRRMCGGYIARDDFISKFKATNMSPEDIQASTITG